MGFSTQYAKEFVFDFIFFSFHTNQVHTFCLFYAGHDFLIPLIGHFLVPFLFRLCIKFFHKERCAYT